MRLQHSACDPFRLYVQKWCQSKDPEYECVLDFSGEAEEYEMLVKNGLISTEGSEQESSEEEYSDEA